MTIIATRFVGFKFVLFYTIIYLFTLLLYFKHKLSFMFWIFDFTIKKMYCWLQNKINKLPEAVEGLFGKALSWNSLVMSAKLLKNIPPSLLT